MTAINLKNQEHYTDEDAINDVRNSVKEYYELKAVMTAHSAPKKRPGFLSFFKPLLPGETDKKEKTDLLQPSASSKKQGKQ